MPEQVPGFLIVAASEFIASVIFQKESTMANFEIEKVHCCTVSWRSWFRSIAHRAFFLFGIATVLEACLLPRTLVLI